jgi:non-specific serine/threonine protein kinase
MERRHPVVRNERRQPASDCCATEMCAEGGDWWRWLDSPGSVAFRYEHPAGGFTARREQRKREAYWYAYRKRSGVVRKAYLGRTRDLTAARLDTVALLLAHLSSDAAKSGRAQASKSPRESARLLDNLPAHLPQLIGREYELRELCQALLSADRGLLTLTGTGGCGKTRLALEMAATLRNNFADGAWYVELAGVGDPALAPMAVAAALGLVEAPGHPVTETLRRSLRERTLLLVLDNCEHLIHACAKLVDDLLSGCSGLRVLATSREPLRIAGEVVRRVAGLATPEPESTQADAVELATFAAVRLFAERARGVRPDFAVGPRNVRAVGGICSRLGGLPLAIELAAARVPVMSPEEIVASLNDGFRLLSGGSRTAPPRQQTLRATLDWSHELLSPIEQTLFRRLAVFAGGFDLDSVEVVGGQDPIQRIDVLDLLARLVDKSLVQADPSNGVARYRLLEPVRQYAREQLTTSGEGTAAEASHAAYFVNLAETAEPKLMSVDRGTWVARLETEHQNLRSALSWLLSAGEAETALRLATALTPFWSNRGHLSEGRSWLERALTTARPDVAAERRAKALSCAGMLAMLQGDPSGARALLQESLTLLRATGGPREAAEALGMLAHAVHFEGDIPAMVALGEQSLALYRELDDRPGMAGALGQLGHAAWHKQDYPAAWALLNDALTLLQELKTSWSLWNPFMSITHVLWTLGNVARDGGDYVTARSLYAESMAAAQAQGSAFHVAVLLDSFASLAAACGDAARAARLLGAAEVVRRANDVALAPVYRRDFYDAISQNVHAALDAASLRGLLAEGAAMSWDQAVAYALTETVDSSATTAQPGVHHDRLTARELQILGLVADGKSNPTIAHELVLSVYTVERHVANIYAKIGVHTRVEASTYALRHGLV